jgi:hypothetical protein
MNEVFHHIRCCGKTFTSDEWGDYCAKTRDGEQRIETMFGKYTFNDCDICINPEKQNISVRDGGYGYYIILKWAYCGNGLWSFGLDYGMGTAGGGFGVSWADTTDGKDGSYRKGYASEKECKVAACRYAMNIVKQNNAMCDNLRRKIREFMIGLQRPEIVQLELF